MGVRTYRGQIVCDVRWPDGSRTIRVFAKRTAAKNLRDRIKGSIADGSWRALQEKLRLRDRDDESFCLMEYSQIYIDEYAKPRNKKRAWERKKVSLKALNTVLGKLKLQEITHARLHKYVQKRKLAGVSNGTINRDLTTLKHLLKYATESGVIQFNPVESLKKLYEEEKERPRFTDQQIQAVLDKIRPDSRPLFTFIRETGCRREEALSLQHWQIQLDSRLVVFSENTKSKKLRYVPLTEEAVEAVTALPKLPGCPYVFYSQKTKTRWAECRKPWHEARKEANVPDLQVKDLRRHYAIKLAERGADMHDIQQVLGHSSVQITEKHYAHFSPTHSAKKVLHVLEGGKAVERSA